MLGAICQRANRSDQAISYFRTSLRLDPLMFDSLKALCDLGVQDAEDLINVPPSAAAAALLTPTISASPDDMVTLGCVELQLLIR